MKHIFFHLTLFFLIGGVFFNVGCTQKTPVDDVYMYIGAVNPKTSGARPVIKVPEGRIGLFPAFAPRMTDWYFADKIAGFPLNVGNLMVNTGTMKVGVMENASRFDHDMETTTPYYYQVLLEDPNVNTEFTVTDNTVFFRFTLPENETSNLFLNLSGDAGFEIKGSKIIEGEASTRNPRNNEKNYFYAELSRPFFSCGAWQNDSIFSDLKTFTGSRIGFYVSYPAVAFRQIIELKIGFSSNSIDEARSFAADEIGALSFEQVKDKAKKSWNEELSAIKVEGGTEKQRELFYTMLHLTRVRMGNVWDTYRCAYPLQDLIKPDDTNKTIQNWIKRYEETGWLPSSGAMIGHHSTAVIVDAYFRGIRDYDIEKAYEGMRKNAMEATMIPWKDEMYITELEQCYFDDGFFPALPVRKEFNPTEKAGKYEKLPYQTRWLPEPGVEEWVKEVDSWHRRQSVSVTLEHCYDDWCLAQLAKELGKDDDYQLFMKRAHNYQNLFNPEIGFMAPKSADGKWIEPFDPNNSGGFAGEGYFAECNSWIYTWHVQHDVQGLINLMGGKDKFLAKLNELFVTNYRMDKLQFLAQFPDMTGLMGMYCQGNEPAFHIPYLYNYAGQPWMTQNKVRQIMKLWYDTTPFGLSGDEDGGAMSGWYVLSAMGLYPLCPGRPIFDIGSPIFDKVTIHAGKGKVFIIEAKNVSDQNKYIQSATLNGKPFNQPWINHSDIVKGGKLVFRMASRPNKKWGSSPDVAPPSMSAPAQ